MTQKQNNILLGRNSEQRCTALPYTSKKANEAYWAKKISADELLQTAKEIREANWKTQKDAGIDLIPSNDFSFYDQVLDLSLTVGAIPARYNSLLSKADNNYSLDLYFAMARGFKRL